MKELFRIVKYFFFTLFFIKEIKFIFNFRTPNFFFFFANANFVIFHIVLFYSNPKEIKCGEGDAQETQC